MNDRSVITPPPIPANDATPPLVEGDRLTREEFERRYDAMPNLKKAELIEGVVHMPSPVRVQRHGEPSRFLSTWLGVYQAATPGLIGADNTTVRLDQDNEPQPDGLLMIDPALGGQARISVDDYVEESPELVAEISSSTVKVDLGAKFRVYQRTQVREYVVWRVVEKEVDWFILRQYGRLQPGPDGILKSEVFPGLCSMPRRLSAATLPACWRLSSKASPRRNTPNLLPRFRKQKSSSEQQTPDSI